MTKDLQAAAEEFCPETWSNLISTMPSQNSKKRLGNEMTSRDFCYWLQGYFEIEGNQPRPPEYSRSLNSEQIKMIERHLAMVFKHEIDPSYGNQQMQDVLSHLHKPSPDGTLIRC